jgi:hypothetical protein
LFITGGLRLALSGRVDMSHKMPTTATTPNVHHQLQIIPPTITLVPFPLEGSPERRPCAGGHSRFSARRRPMTVALTGRRQNPRDTSRQI